MENEEERAMRRRITLPISMIIMLLMASLSAVAVGAYHEGDDATHPFADEAFERTWARTDEPVAAGEADRTWMWGPEPYTPGRMERYDDSPGGQRLVQYFDKARMEINNPLAEDDDLWFVTNGLLVVEMMDGNIQVGNEEFVPHSEGPSTENVAGDPGADNGPTYATMAGLRDAAPAESGAVITQRLAQDGTISDDPEMAEFDVTAAFLVEEWNANHQVASVFWDFMHSSGTVFVDGEFSEAPLFESPFYATGYPITEPYWTEVRVEGTLTDVLIQCFERRCLTFTPQNEPEWQVEAGNVGQHYFRWRESHTGGGIDDGDDNGNGNDNPGLFIANLTGVGGAAANGVVSLTLEDGTVGLVGIVADLDAETDYEVRVVATEDCADIEGAAYVGFSGQSDAAGLLLVSGSLLEADLTADLSSSVLVIYDVSADTALSCGPILTDTAEDTDV
jgi:hypothetical protein